MPPIASPLLIEAQTTREGVLRRLKDLNEYQIPRLRDCKGPLTLQQQFAAELRDDTEALTRQLEELSALADDQERESERAQVNQWADDLSAELARLKTDSRNALLTSKRAIDSDAKSRRDELLGSAALLEKRAADAEAHKQRATDDKLMAATDDVTEALRRTTRLMQQELERSVLSTRMLQESSKTLRATSDSYTSLDNLMDASQMLIKALQRADWMDRIIIGLSLGVFLLTVAYILKRRVLDRVVSVATLPMRLVGSSSPSHTVVKGVISSAETASLLDETTRGAAVSLSTGVSSSSTLTPSKVQEILTNTVSSSVETGSILETLSSTVCSDSVCPAAESNSEAISVLDKVPTATRYITPAKPNVPILKLAP